MRELKRLVSLPCLQILSTLLLASIPFTQTLAQDSTSTAPAVMELPDGFSQGIQGMASSDGPEATYDSFIYDDNAWYNQRLIIPPDPSTAVGTSHVVSTCNSLIEWRTKDGVLQHVESLRSFFSALSFPRHPYDTSVLYDASAHRFVIVSDATGGMDANSYFPANDTSLVLIAVSTSDDPNDGWTFNEFSAMHQVPLTVNSQDYIINFFADFPRAAVCQQALYITCDYFPVDNLTSISPGLGAPYPGGLWIIDKSELYANGNVVATKYIPSNEIAQHLRVTNCPVQVYGAVGGNVGTFLIRNNAQGHQPLPGTSRNLHLGIIRIDNPLDNPTFHYQEISTAGVDDLNSYPYYGPQAGSSKDLEFADRRPASCVWRNGYLWVAGSVVPPSGVDAHQSTVHWWKISTADLGQLALVDEGDIGGEEIDSGTATSYGSITVGETGDVVIGFSASGPNIHPGAYYTYRRANAGTAPFRPAQVLAEGLDIYYRTHDRYADEWERRNRWGDYSTAVPDPGDPHTFWLYNEYAILQGVDDPNLPLEHGRWGLRLGKVVITPDTTHVPLATNSIQTAINQTAPDDVVAVDGPDGIGLAQYDGVLTMRPGVAVIAAPGTGTPVLNAQGASQGVIFHSDATEGTRLEGFRLTNFSHYGVYVGPAATSSTAARVKNCEIVGGKVGVWSIGANLRVEDCRIHDQMGGLDAGAGVYVEDFNSADGHTIQITNNVLVSPEGDFGINASVGYRGLEISRNTISGWGKGIFLDIGSDDTSIEANLVVNSVGAGIDCDWQYPVLTCNDAFGNGTNYLHCGNATQDANISLDPKFCGGREGLVDDLSLRIDSPCAAPQAPVRSDAVPCGQIGAEAPQCAWGSLASNTTVEAGDVWVLEDVDVLAGVTLTCEAGVVLRLDSDDDSEGGIYSTKNELLVDGALVCDGVTIESDSETPTAGDWGSVVIRNNGTASIQNTTINGAEVGVLVQGTADASLQTVQVQNCTVAAAGAGSASLTVSGLTTSPNVLKGVQLVDSAQGQVTESAVAVNGQNSDGLTVSGSATLSLTSSSVSAARYGVYVTGGSANISDGNDVSLASVGVMATGGEVEVYDGTYHDLETGIWANGGSIDMIGGTIEDCTWGAWVDGAGGQLTLGQADGDLADSTQVLIRRCSEMGVGIDSQGPNQLTQVRVEGGAEAYWTGIQVLPSANCTMTRCSVANATGGRAVGMLIESQATLHAPKVANLSGLLNAGIRIDADSLVAVTIDSVTTMDGLWRRPQIRNCYYGIDVTSTARPTLRAAVVEDHYTCVNIGPAAVPDLGHDWNGQFGNNVIRDAASKLAGGKTRIDGFPDVPAQQNFWGIRIDNNVTPPETTSVPDASKISAWVDYFPYLQQNPLGQQRILVRIGPIGTTPSAIQAAFPMPFADRVNIPLVVGSVNEPVEAGVFDVAGRRVRTLHSGQLPMGTHVLAWDGLTDDGSHASSGVYFIRVRLGKAESTQKLVLAR